MKLPVLMSLPVLLLGATAAADGPSLDSSLRFHNRPIVTAVDDRRPIPPPAERVFHRSAHWFDTYLGRRVARQLEARPPARAGNVNALDEVPDSSWFHNRVGVREVAAGELRRSPAEAPQPPFTVVGGKVGGTAPGVRVRDARGGSYLLKFDGMDDPDGQTGADIVVQRLLWTVGYHTAQDDVLMLVRTDLRLDPKARLKDERNRSRPMVEADLTSILGEIRREPDGRYRALASRFLSGRPLGGVAAEGVRPDDANDRLAHEERRELRAGQVFFAWVNHLDIKDDNFVDTWLEDPRTPGRGYVRHNLVDFGNSLGVFTWRVDRTPGFANFLDVQHGARSLVSFGLWRRPWEQVQPSELPGVGNFQSAYFDPAGWKSRYPWAPLERFDRFDGLWAAKVLMRVRPEHVATAVAEARYRDPRAAAYIARTLVERQRKLGRHHLARTSALDRFTVDEEAGVATLCFEDLLLAHFGAEQPALVRGTRYRAQGWDHEGRPLPTPSALSNWRPGTRDRVCLAGIPAGTTHDGYTIVGIDTARAGAAPQRILVHLARDPLAQRPRVIGLRRF